MSVSPTGLADGVVLIGSQFCEPMWVVGNHTAGDGFVLVNVVGTRTSSFPGCVTLTKTDLGSIQIEVNMKATLKEGQTTEQLNLALTELGIGSQFNES